MTPSRSILRMLAAVTVAWAPLCSLSSAGPQAAMPPAGVEFRQLIFEDSFEQLDIGFQGEGEHRWYALRSLGKPPIPSLFSTARGILSLTTPPSDAHGANTSIATFPPKGRAYGTPTEFQFGYFEARMRFDPNPRNWPAFWLLGETGLLYAKEQRSHWCEIDIMEGVNLAAYGGTVHDWTSGKSSSNRNAVIKVPPGTDFKEWNVFGARWTAHAIDWYLNGRRVSSAATPEICRTERMFLIIGSNKQGGQTAQKLDVDWIRVYR